MKEGGPSLLVWLMKQVPAPEASRIPRIPTAEAVSQLRSLPRKAATAIQIARTRSATPRVMWAISRPMGAAVFHPDPESGTVSQKVLAIPRSSWPRRVTTIAAPRVRIRVDVVGSAGAIMPTRLSQRRTHHSQRYGRQWGFGL